MRRHRYGLALCLLAGTQAHAAAPPQIGTTAVAKNEVSGTIGKELRALKRGDGVFQDESIATGRDSGAQFLFADETVMTMGPNSRMVLDSFVYDHSRRSGKMVVRAVSGAFRFVTGSAPRDGYKIATPVGSIGVRGTIIQFWISAGQLTLKLDEGGAYFCAGQKCVELDKPGTYIVATAQQVGSPQSKNDRECGASGGSNACHITGSDQTLYLQFLGRRPFDDITPSVGPNFPPPPPENSPPPPPPANSPPPPPTQTTKFGVPLPPAIADRINVNPTSPAISSPAPLLLPPTPTPTQTTKFGVPLPPAIANRMNVTPR